MDIRVNRWVRILVIGFVAVYGLILLAGVRVQRSKPDLGPWHTVALRDEFDARDAGDGFGWRDYLAVEDALFNELANKIVEPSRGVVNPAWSRYAAGGVNDPESFPRNWNRSFELAADPPRGGVLLIHGLTDSPYSLRRPGEILNAGGFHVVGVRLPGHGTAPSAMRSADVADWRAAVRVAYQHLRNEVGDSGELMVVGYSNGGALAIDLALTAMDDADLPVPDRIVLFSPAIGITRTAALAASHKLLTFMPWFDKLGWMDILPEYDPFKYNSFHKNSASQTHRLTTSVRGQIARLQTDERTADFPPVLTFMSLADATVLVEAVIEGLYDRLSDPENELVIFDINRSAAMRGFFRTDPAARLSSLAGRPSTEYRLTVITNSDDESAAVVERTRAAGTEDSFETELGLTWPPGVYSLSHVAVNLPPDDAIYGLLPAGDARFGLQIGAIEPRGERGILAVSANTLTRLRSNPFFPYVERRLIQLVGTVD